MRTQRDLDAKAGAGDADVAGGGVYDERTAGLDAVEHVAATLDDVGRAATVDAPGQFARRLGDPTPRSPSAAVVRQARP